MATRKSNLKFRYGITEKEYDHMQKDQESKCKICGLKTNLCVDHCHKTQKVRGLLCHNCNVALGHMQDNVNYLAKAICYLTDYAA